MKDRTASEIAQATVACANEPIQFSGGIQPHGYLFSCHPTSGIVRHVSANCGQLFECDPSELIGQPIDDFIQLPSSVAELAALQDGAFARYVGSANIGAQARYCDVSLHLAQGLAHLEVEPQPVNSRSLSAGELAHEMIVRLTDAQATESQLHDEMARQVRLLTGFDRVMIYRFLDDDTGEVIAESLAEGVQSYLGVRYPASDIPPQARALYLRNRVRVIASTDYVPSPIQPAVVHDGAPLDLSMHGLRSVSPVHLEYMRNMGMAASMSISIIVDDRLWGLVACHHRTPRQLPPRHRTAADLLGMFYSLRVTSMQHLKSATRKTRARAIRTEMLRALASVDDPSAYLAKLLPELQEIVPADAAVLVTPQDITVVGDAVTATTLDAARTWFEAQPGDVAASHVASEWMGDAASEGHAGLLGMRLTDGRSVLLLRREESGEVSWAGEPVKHLVTTDDGVRLAPRRSFNIWREMVSAQAQPWSREDLEDAEPTAMLLRQTLPSAS
ncbi:GAF domain-containing protein [Solilutibacter tolerans]|uniref:PAS fold-containing protein n=1 Tax=Solilutibacter tolerans TaxID=1604334 RepID=A0A1N6RLT2_9GAMM|nr:GAF domain-containing protein [Lysobacter tolerans]SIQ29848.1 PAS fold-containing protein [Lysobacter tolerans]